MPVGRPRAPPRALPGLLSRARRLPLPGHSGWATGSGWVSGRQRARTDAPAGGWGRVAVRAPLPRVRAAKGSLGTGRARLRAALVEARGSRAARRPEAPQSVSPRCPELTREPARLHAEDTAREGEPRGAGGPSGRAPRGSAPQSFLHLSSRTFPLFSLFLTCFALRLGFCGFFGKYYKKFSSPNTLFSTRICCPRSHPPRPPVVHVPTSNVSFPTCLCPFSSDGDDSCVCRSS